MVTLAAGTGFNPAQEWIPDRRWFGPGGNFDIPMNSGLSSDIAKIPPGGLWRATKGIKRTAIERAAAIAERRTGRLLRVGVLDGNLVVEDVTDRVAARPARRNAAGEKNISGSVRGVLSRSVVAELGGEDACRALVQKFLGGKTA